MTFGVSVGAKCLPSRWTPLQHMVICDEALDSWKPAAHTAKALGREHRFQRVDFNDAVCAKKSFSVLGAWSAFYIDSSGKTQRVFRHPYVHGATLLQPLCKADVIGMGMGDEDSADGLVFEHTLLELFPGAFAHL